MIRVVSKGVLYMRQKVACVPSEETFHREMGVFTLEQYPDQLQQCPGLLLQQPLSVPQRGPSTLQQPRRH